MTVYQHEVQITVRFKTTRKLRSKVQVLRIAERLEHSQLNDVPEGVIDADRRFRFVTKRNQVVKE